MLSSTSIPEFAHKLGDSLGRYEGGVVDEADFAAQFWAERVQRKALSVSHSDENPPHPGPVGPQAGKADEDFICCNGVKGGAGV